MRDAILILNEEQRDRETIAQALREWSYSPVEASTAAEAFASFEQVPVEAVLLDIDSANGSSAEVLRELKRRQPDAVVILMTASMISDDLMPLLRSGASDFIGKPIHPDELRLRIGNGIEAQRLRRETNSMRQVQAGEFSFDQIIGHSPSMREMLRLARKVADSEITSVLLQGESGTGKDCVAKSIHFASKRADHQFVAINCAALPPNLIESELFGHEKGAFTDARARKEGLLEQGNGGTVFLDEISELDINLQAKLLRVLEEGCFRRVGGLKDVPFTARVIAASNRDLRSESKTGRFRLDLYYRLAVIQIDIPPLRARGDDVMMLAQHFITFNSNQKIKGLMPEVARAFQLYRWPGNVRELRNVIERALVLEDSDMISARYLPLDILPDAEAAHEHRVRAGAVVNQDATVSLPREGISLDEVETSLLRQALAHSNGNKTRAAELLGLTRDQFRYRLKKLREPHADRHAVGARTMHH